MEEVAAALSAALPTLGGLRELRLRYLGLRVWRDHVAPSSAFNALTALRNLEVLSLCACRIDAQEATWLAASLRVGCMLRLRDVDLSQNFQMRNKGVRGRAVAFARAGAALACNCALCVLMCCKLQLILFCTQGCSARSTRWRNPRNICSAYIRAVVQI